MKLTRAFVAIACTICSSCGRDEVNRPPVDLTLSVPFFDAGANDEIALPWGATRLKSGVVVVVDAMEASLLFFDTTGQLLRRVGRKGFGPGEYQLPAWAGRCGSDDELFVWDPLQSRMTVLDTAGKVLRQFVFGKLVERVACAPDANVFAYLATAGGPNISDKPGHPTRRYAELVIADLKGDDRVSVPHVQLRNGMLPLGTITTIAMTRNAVWLGTADSGYVDRYSLHGRRLGSVPLGLNARNGTRAEYDRYVERALSEIQDLPTREDNRRYFQRYGPPDYMPVYGKLLSDPKGNVWVTTSGYGGDTFTRIRGVTPSGRVVADLTIPKRAAVYEIGSDYVLAGYGFDDQPHIAVYRLTLPRGP